MYRSLLIAVSLIILFPCPGTSSSDPVRFFRTGDGTISIRNEHNGREATVNLFDADGRFNEKALDAIDGVFGFSDGRKGEHISLRLLILLDYFSDKVAPGKMIHLISGYRSPAYNQKLKKSGGNVARTSTHMDGMALDFYLEGIGGKVLWEAIRKENCCGVGHYGGKSIHLDSGKPRFWEAATSKTGTRESEFNRKLYLSTEYDRYRQGEKVRFLLTSLSDFPFGIRKTAALVKDGEGKNDAAVLTIQGRGEEECVMVNDRNASRSIRATLPAGLEAGRYRIRFDFCRRPFEQMPTKTLSNEIEIVGE
ncbi:MAG: DUF882 domain-containing protein [Syntrophorhabdaceae bacterium]|nr:DUF882 domain-containing protein [Syntrophorhabdaceae bacterium]